MKNNNILEISNLTKSFGHKRVVDNVSFQVKEGSFYALLGSNGAGKTTTLNIILLFLSADDGSVIFDGHDYVDNYQNLLFFKSQIGVVFQESVLDQNLTVAQNLEFAAGMYHLSAEEQKKNIREVISLLEIRPLLSQKVKTLSGGERRKVDIARAIINHPKILFLDELTAGLDAAAQKIVWDIVKKLNQEQNTTVIFTTHYLEETELSDQVLILHHGKVIDCDNVPNLKNKYHLNYVEINSAPSEKMELILTKEKINFNYQNNCYHVYFHNEEQLNVCLTKLNEFLKNFKVVHGSMRDVFLHAVGVEI